MKLSIFGTSEIIHHHIKSAKNNNFKIDSICTSNQRSNNIKLISKKFKIRKIFYNWKVFVKDCYRNKSNVLIAGRIKDNKKILDYCLKYKLKILIEKPIFIKNNDFKNFLKFNKNIFVGYNRIYYQGITVLKKITNKESPQNIFIKCPESNIKNITYNTCHIISIIYYLFGKLRLIKKIKNQNSIFCIFECKKKIPIFINIVFGAPDNFSLEFNFKKIRITLNPVEKLTIFDGLKKKKYKKNNIYLPNISKTINEYNETKFKPGFDNQYSNFGKFINKQKSTFININDANEIIKICNKIIN